MVELNLKITKFSVKIASLSLILIYFIIFLTELWRIKNTGLKFAAERILIWFFVSKNTPSLHESKGGNWILWYERVDLNYIQGWKMEIFTNVQKIYCIIKMFCEFYKVKVVKRAFTLG